MVIRKVYNRVEDFLKDDKFIRAVLCHSSLSADYLRKLKEENEGCAESYEEAMQILLAEKVDRPILTDEECRELKIRIFKTLAI